MGEKGSKGVAAIPAPLNDTLTGVCAYLYSGGHLSVYIPL